MCRLIYFLEGVVNRNYKNMIIYIKIDISSLFSIELNMLQVIMSFPYKEKIIKEIV